MTFIQSLAAVIRDHGIRAYVTPDGVLYAEEVSTDAHGVHREWVTIPATLPAVRAWLGY